MYYFPSTKALYKKKNKKGGDWVEFENEFLSPELDAKQKQEQRK